MSNEKKTISDKIVECADLVYGVAVDRTVERMEQAEANVEKDIKVAKNATNVVIEAAEVVVEAAADQFAALLNGEKIDLTSTKEHAMETMDKLVDKADEYYGAIVDRVAERMEQMEKNIDEDIEAGKQLIDDLKSNS